MTTFKTVAVLILKVFLPFIVTILVVSLFSSFTLPGDDAGIEIKETGQHVNIFLDVPESVETTDVFVRFQDATGQYVGRPVAATKTRISGRIHVYFVKRKGLVAVVFVGNKPVKRIK